MHLYREELTTPLGPLILVSHQEQLLAVDWIDHQDRLSRLLQRFWGNTTCQEHPTGFARAFQKYFEGQLSALKGLALQMAGTPFQRQVWQALLQIPVGQTWSYSQLASQIGNPTAVRAVGLANGCNPLSLVVPCHRVIGANGKLTGYAGGLDRKQWLLDHEASWTGREGVR
jgi:methylated-DNA-[protein]-cysteine S-methyltransferase